MTDEPICRECGVVLYDDNHASSGNICKRCQNAYAKEYRMKNIDVLRNKAHQYYLDNATSIKERTNEYYILHREEENKRRREVTYTRGVLPMSENRECPAFLGIHIAEDLLCKMFKDVIRMPHKNPGYDFICNNGYLMDSKASCKHTQPNRKNFWEFRINKNTIADYFVLLAFDNRDTTNPLHIWMLPGHVVNNQVSVSISESTLDKWNEYRLDIDKVITCCNEMKEK